MTGIAFKNIPFMKNILDIDRDWSAFFRKTALTIILMRAGMGLDPTALKKTKVCLFFFIFSNEIFYKLKNYLFYLNVIVINFTLYQEILLIFKAYLG